MDSLEFLTLILEHAGFEVRGATSAEEALDLAGRQKFHLFLLDKGLPDRSGLELCKELRKRFPKAPILFYSAAGGTKDKEAALRAGAQAYLVKPADVGHILSEVTLWLDHYKK